MSLTTLLLIILVIFLIASLPSWPYSRNWGYSWTGVVGVVLIILLILVLTGNLHIG